MEVIPDDGWGWVDGRGKRLDMRIEDREEMPSYIQLRFLDICPLVDG